MKASYDPWRVDWRSCIGRATGIPPPAQLLTSLLTLPPEQNRALADYVQETKLSPMGDTSAH